MLLVMDVGNTNIVIGLYDKDKRCFDWRIQTDHQATLDEYAMILKNLLSHVEISITAIQGFAISSVVPPLTETLRRLSHKYLSIDPIVLEPGVKTGINILYDHPREVGADRIVNAVAAINQYGSPAIIVDFGTATTFCLIDEQGNYCGGSIVPGIQISLESLTQRTSKLPRVEIKKPDEVIGKNPVHSIQAGLFYGYVSMVDGMVTKIQALLREKATVIATGGDAHLIGEEAETIDTINPYLTLEGLKLIYDRNK